MSFDRFPKKTVNTTVSHPRTLFIHLLLSSLSAAILIPDSVSLTMAPNAPWSNPHSTDIILKPKCGLLTATQNESMVFWSALTRPCKSCLSKLSYYVSQLPWTFCCSLMCPFNSPPPCLYFSCSLCWWCNNGPNLNGQCYPLFQTQLNAIRSFRPPRYTDY